MSVKHLLTPILDGGIRNTNFFEGRLLSAADLRDEQSANRERARRLARAIGPGIVEGLEVNLTGDGGDGTPPVVAVAPGLAITSDGEVIGLPEGGVQVALARSLESVVATEADFFACAGPPDTSLLPAGFGVYLLVMSPAAGYRDRVPKSGLDDAGVAKGCGSRYVQEGVRFRLVSHDPATTVGSSDDILALLKNDLLSQTNPVSVSEPARLSVLRNILAHQCFGTEELAAFSEDPFAAGFGKPVMQRYGVLDSLRDSNRITGCDIPLALIYWTIDGIAFIDLWSVRRRTVDTVPSTHWPLWSSRRYAAESEARFLQFQNQVDDVLQAVTNPSSVIAKDYFLFFPPVAVLPLVAPMRARGLSIPVFLDGRTRRDTTFIEGSRLHSIYSQALQYPAVDLREKEMVWVYLVRENRQPRQGGAEAPPAYALLVSGQLPFYGDARFDVNRWNYSNFGSLRVR